MRAEVSGVTHENVQQFTWAVDLFRCVVVVQKSSARAVLQLVVGILRKWLVQSKFSSVNGNCPTTVG